MFSPSNLMKRVGVGGGLVPFFKCVCVYFALGGADAAPSVGAAAAKCAPVLSLLAAVLLLPPPPGPTSATRPTSPTSATSAAGDQRAQDKDRVRYRARVALGLALSAAGDALLEWPQHFVAGMAAFGAAHLAYSAAFWRRARCTRGAAWCAASLYLLAALFVARLAPPPALRALVALYAALLVTAAAGALATLPPPPRARAALAAPAGALLFLLSDALLGYSLFGGTVPYKQVAVMSTYYLGQLGIALSALLPPTPCPSPPAHAHAHAH